MIPRTLSQQVRQMATWFPVVSVTGPRQSGKSTLVRDVFPDYEYINLEDPQIRTAAENDPVGFLRNRPRRLIIDEAQYVPELFSMIQVISDEHQEQGQYVISGSQNFLLLKRITQSLAGRVGILKLLPLSYGEIRAAQPTISPDAFMYAGGFPRIHDVSMPPSRFFPSYLDTYVQRDVAEYLDVRNLTGFRTFMRLCALNAGNLMNYANLAKDADIDARTAKAWLSMLESSYVTFPLMPYYANASKRLVKTPKLYFHDTGLLCHLLGIGSVDELLLSPHLGAVFENLIVAETLKAHLNTGNEPQMFFYRDDSKIEVDLMDFTDNTRRRLIEIKSGQTYHDRFATHLGRVGQWLEIPPEERYVVARVESSYQAKGAKVRSATDWLLQD